MRRSQVAFHSETNMGNFYWISRQISLSHLQAGADFNEGFILKTF